MTTPKTAREIHKLNHDELAIGTLLQARVQTWLFDNSYRSGMTAVKCGEVGMIVGIEPATKHTALTYVVFFMAAKKRLKVSSKGLVQFTISNNGEGQDA